MGNTTSSTNTGKSNMSRFSTKRHNFDQTEWRHCSTQHELKIWFTKPNSDKSLGCLMNEIRLIKARQLFPQHTMRLIYEPKNLTATAKRKISLFCKKHHIELVSVDDIETELLTANNISQESLHIQQQLLAFARKECQSGNLATASDIVRLLTPALRVSHKKNAGRHETRIYSDFDEPLSPNLPNTLKLGKNELLKTYGNNNFIFAYNSESAVMQLLRRKIVENYGNAFNLLEIILCTIQSKLLVPLNHSHFTYSADEKLGWLAQKSLIFWDNDANKISAHNVINYLAEQLNISPDNLKNDVFALRNALIAVSQVSTINATLGKILKDVIFEFPIHLAGPRIYQNQNNLLFKERSCDLFTLSRNQSERSDISWGNTGTYSQTAQCYQNAGKTIARNFCLLFKQYKQRQVLSYAVSPIAKTNI